MTSPTPADNGTSFDMAVFTVLSMAKAARVLAALKRDGWSETRRSGSPGSPVTTAIPLLSCGSYRTIGL
jgi:hypothetical protein